MGLKEDAIARFEGPLKAFILEDVMAKAVKGALDKFVADSSNPYDDALVAMLWPLLEQAAKDGLEKLAEKV